MLPKEAIDEFKEIYKKEKGEELDDAKALADRSDEQAGLSFGSALACFIKIT